MSKKAKKAPKREPVVIDRPREGESDEEFADRFANKMGDVVVDMMNKELARRGEPPLK